MKKELKDLPILPIYTSFLSSGFEVTFQTIKAINLLSLLFLSKIHKNFTKIRPEIEEKAYRIQKIILNLNFTKFIPFEKKITKILIHLRKTKPKQYYQMYVFIIKPQNVPLFKNKKYYLITKRFSAINILGISFYLSQTFDDAKLAF